MITQFPFPSGWSQPNESDTTGTFWATKNIDITSKKGKVRLGNRLLVNTSTVDDVSLNSYPIGFKYYNGNYWTAQGNANDGYLFKTASNAVSGNFSRVTGPAGYPTTIDSKTSDIEVFNGELYVSSSNVTKLYRYNGTTFSTVNSIGGVGDAMMLCAFGANLYCSKSGNQIQSMNTAYAVSSPSGIINSQPNTLYITNTDLVITWIRAASNRIWIGTVNINGGKGYVYEWDGEDVKTTKNYRLQSSGALSCSIKDDIPYIMDADGKLQVWNGGTFVTLTQLNTLNDAFLFNPSYRTNQRYIHPNGVAVIDGYISILIDGTNFDVSGHNGTQEETISSGIYEYDDATKSLINKYSFGTTYSGAAINDYGQFRIYGAGGMAQILTAQSGITTDGQILAGCSYYTDATSVVSGIFYNNSNNTLQKGGYFVTSKIQSSQLSDKWQKLWIKFRQFLFSTDKLVIKYRIVEAEPTDVTITWISNNAFTTPTDITSYWTTGTGGEVEILQGIGAGKCSHVISIIPISGGYRVTLEDTFTGVAYQTGKARFQAWIKIGSYSAQASEFTDFPIATASSWIQFKVFLLFTGKNEINKLLLVHATHQPVI